MDKREVTTRILEKLGDSQLVFVAREPERGLGVNSFLGENYNIFASQPSYLAEQSGLEGRLKILTEANNSSEIIRHPEFIDFLKTQEQEKLYLQFFKPIADSTIEELRSLVGKEIQMLNCISSLARRLENKIEQFNYLQTSDLGENLAPTKIGMLSQMEHSALFGELGEYVLQMPYGHTGESTYLGSEQLLNELKEKYPKREVKIVKKLTGRAYTINGMVTSSAQVFLAGLAYQFTGLPEATPVPMATVGTDWKIWEQSLSNVQVETIKSLTTKVGGILQQKGYSGLFGIDLIVEFGTNNIYLIEINSRQTLNIPELSLLQHAARQVPLQLLNIAHFLGVDLREINQEQYNSENIVPHAASQLIARFRGNMENFSGFDYLARKSGVYRQMSDNAAREASTSGKQTDVIFLDETEDRPIIWQGDYADFSKIEAGFGLAFSRSAQENLKLNQEIARIQANRSLAQIVGDEIKLIPLAKDLLGKITNYTNHEN
ncbi:MAG: hypothetical protein ACOCXP_02845 [Candidatus Dojkabacteria bacterium]